MYMEVGLLFQLLAVDAECRHRARTRICRMQNVEVIMQSESPKNVECRCSAKTHDQEMRDVHVFCTFCEFTKNVKCVCKILEIWEKTPILQANLLPDGDILIYPIKKFFKSGGIW